MKKKNINPPPPVPLAPSLPLLSLLVGDIDSQKKSWLKIWPALLKTGVGAPPFHAALMMSSSGLPSRSVPLIWLLQLVTYAWWCLPQWRSIVFLEILGSSASWRERGGRVGW